MDELQQTAVEFSKLFNKDFIYEIDDGLKMKLIFAPGHFHHLLGLNKLKDIDMVAKSPQNSANYIYGNIYNGSVTLNDVKKSRFFDEIELRFRHFKQINVIAESAKVIYQFDPALIKSEKLKAGCILFKMSNDNMYLNLLIKIDDAKGGFYVPYTFIPRLADDYIRSQKEMRVKSMTVTERAKKVNQAHKRTPDNDDHTEPPSPNPLS